RAPDERWPDRAPGLELLAHALIACGELGEAAAAAETLRETARQIGTAPLRASADLAEGMLAAASGDHERARPLLEDAADGFERSGAPFEALQAGIELATSLVALGQPELARQEATSACERLRRLGAMAEAERADRLLEALGRGGTLAALSPRERD